MIVMITMYYVITIFIMYEEQNPPGETEDCGRDRVVWLNNNNNNSSNHY